MNTVNLTGRLTKDCELKYTQSGKAVATFTIAVDKFSNSEKKADFINCVVWDKSAEALANYTHKGSKIGVVGSISTRNYENQQGQRVYVTEVIANQFGGIEFLDNKSDNQQGGQQNQQSQQAKTQNDPFAKSTQVDVMDDDLPF